MFSRVVQPKVTKFLPQDVDIGRYVLGLESPPPLFFLNNSVKDQPNVVIFGTPRPEETRHCENLNMPNSPRNCCRTALPCKCNKVIFQRYSRIIAKINGGGVFGHIVVPE